MSTGTCEVVSSWSCKDRPVQTKCYRCGQYVCKACSKVRPRISIKRRPARICDNCWESEKDDNR